MIRGLRNITTTAGGLGLRTSPSPQARMQHTTQQAHHNEGDNMTYLPDKFDSHCTTPGCGCDHINCYRGWIDNTKGTWPCMYCRENLTGRLMRATQAHDQGYPQATISRIMQKATR